MSDDLFYGLVAVVQYCRKNLGDWRTVPEVGIGRGSIVW